MNRADTFLSEFQNPRLRNSQICERRNFTEGSVKESRCGYKSLSNVMKADNHIEHPLRKRRVHNEPSRVSARLDFPAHAFFISYLVSC